MLTLTPRVAFSAFTCTAFRWLRVPSGGRNPDHHRSARAVSGERRDMAFAIQPASRRTAAHRGKTFATVRPNVDAAPRRDPQDCLSPRGFAVPVYTRSHFFSRGDE